MIIFVCIASIQGIKINETWKHNLEAWNYRFKNKNDKIIEVENYKNHIFNV